MYFISLSVTWLSLILHLSYVTIILADLVLYSIAYLHSKIGPNIQINY